MRKTLTSKNGQIKLDTNPLAALAKEIVLTAKAYVKVGILDQQSRSPVRGYGGSATNGEIGLLHEFGGTVYSPAHKRVVSIPARSFLRMPLLSAEMALNDPSDDAWSSQVVNYGTMLSLRKLGVAAEGVVQDAFDTGGFGEWAPDSPETIAYKGSTAPLIDSGQLRRSISSEVVVS